MEFILCFKSQKLTHKSLKLLVTLCLFSHLLIAQSYNPDYIWGYNSTGEVFFKSNPMNAGNTKINNQVFNLSNCEYKVRQTATAGEDEIHYLCDLYFNTVKVEGYEFAIHLVGDSISGTGKLVSNNWILSVIPVLDSAEAILAALTDMDSASFYWQNNDIETFLKEITGSEDTTYYPKPKLCIYNNTLCYKMRIYSETPSVTLDYFIDANTGGVVEKWPVSASACFKENHQTKEPETMPVLNLPNPTNVPEEKCMACAWVGCHTGDADILYYGNQSLVFEQHRNKTSNCWQRTKDFCNPALLYVRSGQHSGQPAKSTFATGYPIHEQTTSLSWGTTEQPGTSGLWCIKRAYEYYNIVHSRASYDNANGPLKVLVNDINRAGNAGWLPDGEIRLGTPFGSCSDHMIMIDITTHEMTHGVIQQTANLPNFGEAGALNEGMCDIFGNHADFFTKQNFSTGQLQDYLIGNEACSGGDRDLSNPNSKSMPDTYLGTFWANTSNPADYGGRHINMGVIGFWYFLLAEGSGGSQVNDNSHTYCVKAIGRDKVVKVLYRALKFGYYTSSLTFTDFRSKTILAARDEFGYWSPEVAEMEAAFYAIGVGYNGNSGASTDPPTGNPHMPFVLIAEKTETATEAYHFNNKIQHHKYTVASGADVEVTSNQEIILAALPWDPSGKIDIENGSTYAAYITPACSGVGARLASGSFNNSSVEELNSELKNSIGDEASFSFNIIPNPSSGKYKITLSNAAQYPENIRVVNLLGKIVYKNNQPNPDELDFDITNMPDGLYIVELIYEGKTVSKKIIKN